MLGRVREMQKRGVLHVHVVLAYRGDPVSAHCSSIAGRDSEGEGGAFEEAQQRSWRKVRSYIAQESRSPAESAVRATNLKRTVDAVTLPFASQKAAATGTTRPSNLAAGHRVCGRRAAV